MNKQELIEKYKSALNKVHKVYGDYYKTEAYEEVLKDLKRLDEHENGHADEAPRYVKNILARLRELPLHDREVWLKTIMGEFEQDFSRAKWREGYEQGKVEGLIEREKVTVPHFIAEYIEFKKKYDFHVYGAMREIEDHYDKRVPEWFYEKNVETFVRAWLDGYEVEKEPKYTVKFKATKQYLSNDEIGLHFDPSFRSNFTKSDLEKLGLGWVFDCESMEVEKVGK